jgi:hypothetical protein
MQLIVAAFVDAQLADECRPVRDLTLRDDTPAIA